MKQNGLGPQKTKKKSPNALGIKATIYPINSNSNLSVEVDSQLKRTTL